MTCIAAKKEKSYSYILGIKFHNQSIANRNFVGES